MKDKMYLITEEELVNLLGEMLDDKYNDPCDCADNFLRLKQPIEKVNYRITDKTQWNDTKTVSFDMTNCELSKGKSIAIYIEVKK